MPRARFSRAAERDLLAIWLYGAGEFGPEQAQRYAAQIDAAVATLLDFPLLGSEVEGRKPALRRLAGERHFLFYRPTPEGIFITRVLHQRMDATRHL